MRRGLLTLYLLTGFAILEGCASWRVNSFIVDHERTVVPASEPHGGQFLSDLVAVDSGARTALGTQGRPDYIFVEHQSVFGSSIIKLAYIGDDRLVVLKRFANNSTVSIESGAFRPRWPAYSPATTEIALRAFAASVPSRGPLPRPARRQAESLQAT